MITWYVITDDFGEEVMVTDYNYANGYHSRMCVAIGGLMLERPKGKKR